MIPSSPDSHGRLGLWIEEYAFASRAEDKAIPAQQVEGDPIKGWRFVFPRERARSVRP